jgi:hypothetical protein
MKTASTSIVMPGLLAVVLSGGLLAQAQAHGATLGAGPAAFAAAFGAPVQDLGVAKFYLRCAGAQSPGKWGVTFKGGRATGIERSACAGEILDEDAVAAEAPAVMPADAKPVREFRTTDGRRAHEFRSVSLGQLFPASDFVTCDEKGKTELVAAGTLSYARAKDGKTWMLAMGKCF